MRRWVKVLPYFIVKRLAMWGSTFYVTLNQNMPRDWFALFEIDAGEYLLIKKQKYKKIREAQEEKERRKREKAKEKAKVKLYRILHDFPELRDELPPAANEEVDYYD